MEKHLIESFSVPLNQHQKEQLSIRLNIETDKSFDNVLKIIKEMFPDEYEKYMLSCKLCFEFPIIQIIKEKQTIQENPKYKNDKKLKHEIKARENLIDLHDSSKIKERLRRKLKIDKNIQ